MRFEGHQKVVYSARPVGHGHNQAGAVVAGRGWGFQGLRQTDDGEAGAVVGVILDGVRGDVQAKLACTSLTRQARPCGVGRGQPGAFGVAGDGAAFSMRQVLGQPGLALGQRQRMGQHGFYSFERILQSQEVVTNQQRDFADHLGGGVQKQVERASHHALGRVFHPHDAELRAACRRGMKHFIKVGAVDQVGGATKKLNRGLLTKCASRPQHGYPLRRFKCQAGRHDLAPDGR